jgi:hypothetical protein
MDLFGGVAGLAGGAVDAFTGGASEVASVISSPALAAESSVLPFGGLAAVSSQARSAAGDLFAGMYDPRPPIVGTGGMHFDGEAHGNKLPNGQTGGYGTSFEQTQSDGSKVSLPPGMTGPGGRADFGYYTDANGQGHVGANAQAQTVSYQNGFDIKGEGKRNTHVGFDAAGPNAWARSSASGNDFEMGAEANAGSIGFGQTTTDPNSDTDSAEHIGLSEGLGAAFRIHDSDADHDGNREYGFGFDAGPVSFDAKSEDPVREALGLAIPFGLGNVLLPGSDQKPGQEGNLTRQLGDEIAKDAEKVPEKALEIAKNVEETVEKTPEVVLETIEKAPEALENAASDVGATVSKGLGAVGSFLGF